MSETAIRIQIVEEFDVLRFGLSTWLEDQQDMTVVASVATLAEALRCHRDLAPDVLITGSTLPDGDGAELVRRVRAVDPSVGLVVLSPETETRGLDEAAAWQAGASAVLGIDAGCEDVVRSARQVGLQVSAVV